VIRRPFLIHLALAVAALCTAGTASGQATSVAVFPAS
jgi:hypothetical protein